jgi:hypothetical protein
MTTISDNDEERVAGLIRALPPAPEAWVKAAQELPRARQEMDEIVARAQADREFREAAIADLQSALQNAGYELAPSLIPELRQRLTS